MALPTVSWLHGPSDVTPSLPGGGGTGVFATATLVLSAPAVGTPVVGFTVGGLDSGDVAPLSGLATFATGATQSIIQINFPDQTLDSDKPATVALSSPVGCTLAGPATVSFTLLANVTPDVPTATLAAGPGGVAVSTTAPVSATATVSLSRASAAAASVDWSISGLSGADMGAGAGGLAGVLTIPAGQKSGTITLTFATQTLTAAKSGVLALSTPGGCVLGPPLVAPFALLPNTVSEATKEVAELAWMVEVDAVGLTLAGEGGSNPKPVVTTLRWSSVSFTTAPTDAPPNTGIEGRLTPGFDLTRELPSGQDGFGAFMDVAIGDLLLENDDQALDALPDTYSVAGRPCRIAFAPASGLGRPDVSGATASDWEDPNGNPVQWDVSGIAATNASVQTVATVNLSAQPVTLVAQGAGGGGSPGVEWDTTGGAGTGSSAGIGQFTYVFKGLVSSWSFAGGQMRLRLTPNSARLDQPITKATYDGSGGLGGTVALKGRTKPYAFGQCNGIEPVLLDPFTLTYQYHGGESGGLSDVRDEGLSLTFVRDCSTYAELQSLIQQGGGDLDQGYDIAIGAYATCYAEGVFRLGGTPAGRLICDVRGAADFVDARDPWDDGTPWSDGTYWAAHRLSAYASGAMHSVYRLLTDFAGFADGTEVDGDQIDHVFGDTDGSFDPSSGLYVASGEQTTIRDAITRLASSVGACIIQNRSGLWQARLLTVPSDPTITTVITDRNLEKGTLQRLDLPWTQPWSKIKVAYDRNWTVLSPQDLAGGTTSGAGGGGSYVVPKIAAFSVRDVVYAEATDAVLDIIWPEAKVSTVDGLVRNEDRAAETAQRLLDFYAGPSRRRGLYQCTAHGIFGTLDFMDVVQLQTARIGIGTRNFLVVGHRDVGEDRSTELTLFG